jgi:uncharacterized membrane protein YecN with MAPEG domain
LAEPPKYLRSSRNYFDEFHNYSEGMSKSANGFRSWTIGNNANGDFDMMLTTTTLYALVLIAIWFVLWIRVTSARSALNCPIGDRGNLPLLQKIRQHGNFIEWVPLVLVLMVLAEAQGADALWLHAAGILLVVGRLAHPFGLRIDNAGHPLRYVGNGTNILAVVVLAIALVRILTGL